MDESKQGNNAQIVQNAIQKGLHPPHHIPLSLVVVGTETALFNEGSKVRERILAYTAPFKEVHIIVLCGPGFTPTRVGNVHLYPTNSHSRIGRFFDGIRIGRSLPHADVVTVQDPFETGLVGWFIARRFRAPLHVQVHTDFLSPEYASLSLLNRLRVHVAGFVLRRAARARVVSGRIKQSIERYGLKAHISVLPIFVDVASIKNTLPTPSNNEFLSKYKYKLLVVARYAPEKNIALAISAFKKVAPPDACLSVFYTTNHPNSFPDVDDPLKRIQFINGQDASRHYKNYDLVLVPSYYEGYGLVIVEALAAGKPVLSTDVGIAREAGAIVTSSENFSDALKDWFESGPRAGELKNYPYKNFDEYVRAYCEDIAAACRGR